MTTDATRAKALALPVTRRHALATTGAGIIASLSLAPRPATAADADTSLADLKALLACHAAAYETDSALWSAVGDVEDAMPELPAYRVEVGYVVEGRDDDGNNIRRPIYASHPDAIEKHYRITADERTWYHARNRSDLAATIRERLDASKRAKLDELAAIEAERRQIEDKCGLTAAMAKARAASDVVKTIEVEILAFVPGTLDAAARLAAWVCERFQDDRAYLTDDDLLVVLASIGKAVQS